MARQKAFTPATVDDLIRGRMSDPLTPGLGAMFKIGMTFNGKKITSSSQLKREIEQAARKAVDDRAPGGAPRGASFQDEGWLQGPGSQDPVKRMMKKLGN